MLASSTRDPERVEQGANVLLTWVLRWNIVNLLQQCRLGLRTVSLWRLIDNSDLECHVAWRLPPPSTEVLREPDRRASTVTKLQSDLVMVVQDLSYVRRVISVKLNRRLLFRDQPRLFNFWCNRTLGRWRRPEQFRDGSEDFHSRRDLLWV